VAIGWPLVACRRVMTTADLTSQRIRAVSLGVTSHKRGRGRESVSAPSKRVERLVRLPRSHRPSNACEATGRAPMSARTSRPPRGTLRCER
jgi:hypothetical protein